MRQETEAGGAMRSVSPAPMGQHFRIGALQAGILLPIMTQYDKVVWSGLSWAAGEISQQEFGPDQPIEIRLSSADRDLSLRLGVQLYAVNY